MPEWLIGLVITVSLGVFADYIRMKIVITRIDFQLGRIASDIESEKSTRKRLHEHFDGRIRVLETHLKIT